MRAVDIVGTPVGTRLIYRATDDRGRGSHDLEVTFVRITKHRIIVRDASGLTRAVSHLNLREPDRWDA